MSVTGAIRDEPSLPRRNGELVFDAPWESRAFSVAVALTEAGVCDWSDFRDRLVAQIGAWDGERDEWDYYARWLAALEQLLLEQRLLSADELAAERARLAHVAAHEHDAHDHGH